MYISELNGTILVKHYTAFAVDPKTGCSDTAAIRVKFEGPVPNAFTPNNDGVNDVFSFRADNNSKLQATIFDRWGNKVYESPGESSAIEWDGRNKNGQECADGVFFLLAGSTTKEGKKYTANGIINLLR